MKSTDTSRPRSNATRRKLIKAREARTVGHVLAGAAGAWLPFASWCFAHNPELPWYGWVLVVAALSYSAPTLAAWASRWCGHNLKAWAFTVLLEGVLIQPIMPTLSYGSLALLVSINAYDAFRRASAKKDKV